MIIIIIIIIIITLAEFLFFNNFEVWSINLLFNILILKSVLLISDSLGS